MVERARYRTKISKISQVRRYGPESRLANERLQDEERLFSDRPTADEKRTIAKLKISRDASAQELARLLTAVSRGVAQSPERDE